jgi:hypothetical protein
MARAVKDISVLKGLGGQGHWAPTMRPARLRPPVAAEASAPKVVGSWSEGEALLQVGERLVDVG